MNKMTLESELLKLGDKLLFRDNRAKPTRDEIYDTVNDVLNSSTYLNHPRNWDWNTLKSQIAQNLLLVTPEENADGKAQERMESRLDPYQLPLMQAFRVQQYFCLHENKPVTYRTLTPSLVMLGSLNSALNGLLMHSASINEMSSEQNDEDQLSTGIPPCAQAMSPCSQAIPPCPHSFPENFRWLRSSSVAGQTFTRITDKVPADGRRKDFTDLVSAQAEIMRRYALVDAKYEELEIETLEKSIRELQEKQTLVNDDRKQAKSISNDESKRLSETLAARSEEFRQYKTSVINGFEKAHLLSNSISLLDCSPGESAMDYLVGVMHSEANAKHLATLLLGNGSDTGALFRNISNSLKNLPYGVVLKKHIMTSTQTVSKDDSKGLNLSDDFLKEWNLPDDTLRILQDLDLPEGLLPKLLSPWLKYLEDVKNDADAAGMLPRSRGKILYATVFLDDDDEKLKENAYLSAAYGRPVDIEGRTLHSNGDFLHSCEKNNVKFHSDNLRRTMLDWQVYDIEEKSLDKSSESPICSSNWKLNERYMNGTLQIRTSGFCQNKADLYIHRIYLSENHRKAFYALNKSVEDVIRQYYEA